ncbi:MAG: Hpt domain-containing protein [SAR324 cluster bacterium]|nr:Hpt domain-containing protein [SAR324 cluster bacterium]
MSANIIKKITDLERPSRGAPRRGMIDPAGSGNSPPLSYEPRVSMVDDLNGKAVVDGRTIRQLRELSTAENRHFVERFIELYLRDATVLVARIAECAGLGDRAELEAMAHKLKGSSLNIGAMQVAELCRRLEERGKSGALDDTPVLAERLQELFITAARELDRIKSQPVA